MAQRGFGWAWKALWSLSAILGMTISAKAGPFTFSGTTSGTFDNPDPASSLTSGVGTASFSWGNTLGGNLTYTGGSFSGQEGQTFTLGTLTYTNGATSGGEPSAIDLNLKLSFDDPKMPDVPLTLTASIYTNPNTVLFDFGQLLLPEGQTTTVPLLGFFDSEGGFQVLGFGDPIAQNPTGGNSTPATTPEPSSLLLAGLGLAGLGLACRKRPTISSATPMPRSTQAG